MQESKNMNIISSFIQEWILCANSKEVLHIKASTFNLFADLHSLKIQEIDVVQNIPKNTLYDLILGDLPFGMNPVEWTDSFCVGKIL